MNNRDETIREKLLERLTAVDVDLGERDLLLLEEPLGRGAVRAPGRDVDLDIGAGAHHPSVFSAPAGCKARVDPRAAWG